jgi:hypothetical protein
MSGEPLSGPRLPDPSLPGPSLSGPSLPEPSAGRGSPAGAAGYGPPGGHSRRDDGTVGRGYQQADPLNGRMPPQPQNGANRSDDGLSGLGRQFPGAGSQQYLAAPPGGYSQPAAQPGQQQYPGQGGYQQAGQMYPQQGPAGGPVSGPPQPAAAPAPVPQPVTVSLPDAVQAAHAEGFGFGDAVARDAPALWLEAVLARKPRMPSDLEARLLQGSALPIDSLLHDEVRHALRRGFWDALERSRR